MNGLLFSTVLLATSPSDVLTIVPEDALVVASTSNFDEIRQRAAENAWVRFLQDPRWRPLIAAFERETDMSSTLAEADLSWLHPMEVLGAIHGQAACYLKAADDGELGGGLLITNDEVSEDFDELFERVGQRLAEVETLISSHDEYGGVELQLFESDSAEDDPDLVMFQTDGLAGFLLSETREGALALAHDCIDRHQGQARRRSFFESKLPGEAWVALDHTPAFRGVVNIRGLLDRFMSKLEQEMNPRAAEVFALLDLRATHWASIQADLGSGETIEFRARLHLPANSTFGRIANLLGPVPVELFERFPSNANNLSAARFDVSGLFEEVESFMYEHFPEAKEQMDSALDDFETMTELHPIDDILERIDGRFGFFSMDIPEEEASELNPLMAELGLTQGEAYVVGLDEPGDFADALEQLLSIAGMYGQLEEEDFQGTLVSFLPLMGSMGVRWTFVHDALAISMYPTPLRENLRLTGRKDAPSAAGTERVKRAIARFPGASALTLTDTAASVEQVLSIIEQLTDGTIPMEDMPQFFELVPDASIAREYFSGALITAVVRSKDVLEIHYSSE